MPRLPPWPGADAFAGRLLHSADYRTGSDFAGARVLVVGLGNSGTEIATDLVEQGAAAVAVSVRSSPPIVRREVAGIPTQVLGILFAPFPPRAVDRVAGLVRRFAIGDLTPYGLAGAEWGPFEARRPPVIDVGFLETLEARRIAVRPALDRLTRTGALFADGLEEEYDVVVAATGFETGLAKIVDAPDVLDERGLPRAARDGSSAHAGLFFIGFRESPRGALYEANRDSRRLARTLASLIDREATPPSRRAALRRRRSSR